MPPAAAVAAVAALAGVTAAIAVRSIGPARLDLLSREHRWLRGGGAARPWSAVGAWFILLVSVGWLVGVALVAAAIPVAGELDEPVTTWFVTHRSPATTAVMRAVTWLGASAVVLPAAAVIAGWWWVRRGSASGALLLVGGYVGASMTYQLVKAASGRDRPGADIALTAADGAAFPSGHTANAMVLAIGVSLLVLSTSHRQRYGPLAAGVGASFVVAVATSRIYLGVHWVTDVVAGAVIAALWMLVLAIAIRAERPPTPSGTPRSDHDAGAHGHRRTGGGDVR